jgi:hypothetical protein
MPANQAFQILAPLSCPIRCQVRLTRFRKPPRRIEMLGRLEQQSFVSRDEQEVAGYAEVMEAIFESWEAIPLTENYLKQLLMLLRHSTKDERHHGDYKRTPNSVEAFDVDGKSLGVVFQTASPFDTPFRMQELVAWTRETLADRAWHPHPDALKILEEARRAGRITTGEAERLTGAPRPTVKTRLTELVRRGLLQRHGQGRGAWYGPPTA